MSDELADTIAEAARKAEFHGEVEALNQQWLARIPEKLRTFPVEIAMAGLARLTIANNRHHARFFAAKHQLAELAEQVRSLESRLSEAEAKAAAKPKRRTSIKGQPR